MEKCYQWQAILKPQILDQPNLLQFTELYQKPNKYIFNKKLYLKIIYRVYIIRKDNKLSLFAILAHSSLRY